MAGNSDAKLFSKEEKVVAKWLICRFPFGCLKDEYLLLHHRKTEKRQYEKGN